MKRGCCAYAQPEHLVAEIVEAESLKGFAEYRRSPTEIALRKPRRTSSQLSGRRNASERLGI
jgi:hypothetical protein